MRLATRLLQALLLLVAIVPATATAATQVIPGSAPNMTIYVGDTGQLQGVLPGMSDGMFYGSDTGPASNAFYIRPKSGPATDATASGYGGFTPVSNGAPTGNWTPQSPAQVETVYDVTPNNGAAIARVKQTTMYVGYQERFNVVYEVTNTGNEPLQYIAGTAADLYIGGNDSGTGIFIDGPRRFVGGTNTLSAKVGGLQEVVASRLPGEAADTAIPRWASYAEGGYSAMINRLNSFDAFDNTINPAEIDNGVGVSWDDHRDTALAVGETARYEVQWVAEQAVPLRATPGAASVELPGTHTVVLTLSEADGDPVPGMPIRYRVDGMGATPADPADYHRAVTDAAGQVVVQLTGSEPGESTVLAFADVLGAENGTREAAEPQASAHVTWLADNRVDGAPSAPTELTGPSGSVPVQTAPDADNPEQTTFMFGRSASAAAGFGDCTFDGAPGRQLNFPVTVNLQPGAATIDSAELLLVDPGQHDPNATSGATAAPALPVTSSSGNARTFNVECVVNRDLWVRFTLTENGQTETYVIPIGGLLLIDPQGVVYDRVAYDQARANGQSEEQARATAAISGATVRLQRRNSQGDFVNVISGDPGISPNVNPQTTGANGLYQWDVSQGTYRVVVTAPGFTDVESRAVDVPPPVLDLHIPMERVNATGGGGGGGGSASPTPTASPSPTPPATAPPVISSRPAPFTAKLPASRRKVLRFGKARVVTLGTIACPAGATCPAAEVVLRAVKRGKGAKRLPKVLGRGSAVTAGGKAAKLRVRLSKAAAKQLRKWGRTKVRAIVAGTGQAPQSAQFVLAPN